CVSNGRARDIGEPFSRSPDDQTPHRTVFWGPQGAVGVAAALPEWLKTAPGATCYRPGDLLPCRTSQSVPRGLATWHRPVGNRDVAIFVVHDPLNTEREALSLKEKPVRGV